MMERSPLSRAPVEVISMGYHAAWRRRFNTRVPGLGRAYALYFASRGASVVVNDLGVSHTGDGGSHNAADVVVEEIRKAGGKAVANYDSVTDGQKIVDTAMKAFGRVDILINNAGILRDKSFARMTDADWDLVHAVHVKGSYSVTKAAFPIMRQQKYGRIIMTASAAGLYGNFGQANYSAGMGKIMWKYNGMINEKLCSQTRACRFQQLVGQRRRKVQHPLQHHCSCRCLQNVRFSSQPLPFNPHTHVEKNVRTETVMPPEVLASLKPEFVVPVVGYLCHENTEENGGIFEAGGGFVAKLRWERSAGSVFKADETFDPAAVAAKWGEITDFSKVEYPSSITDTDFMALLERAKAAGPNPKAEPLRFDGQVTKS